MTRPSNSLKTHNVSSNGKSAPESDDCRTEEDQKSVTSDSHHGTATTEMYSPQTLLEDGNYGIQSSTTEGLRISPGETLSERGVLVGDIIDDGIISSDNLTLGQPLVYTSGTGASSYEGSQFTGSLAGTGTIEVQSGGTITIQEPVSGSGLTFRLDEGATLNIEAGIGAGNTIDFIGKSSTITIDDQWFIVRHSAETFGDKPYFTASQPIVAATINGFDKSDSIVFVDDFEVGTTITSVTQSGGVVALLDGNKSVSNFFLGGEYSGDRFSVSAPANSPVFIGQTQQTVTIKDSENTEATGPVDGSTSIEPPQGTDFRGGTITVACFVAGTRIATPSGLIAVDKLSEGDKVLTVAGRAELIQWVGRRSLNCRRHPTPERVMPVRIARHAFGQNRPNRPLLLSPDHSVFEDDVLIPIKFLVNGSTVAQTNVPAVTYYHIELERHNVVLAEGLPTETYLETGGRSAFENAGGTVQIYPDFSRDDRRVGMIWHNFSYAPLIGSEEKIERVRARLAVQAAMLGYTRTEATVAYTG